MKVGKVAVRATHSRIKLLSSKNTNSVSGTLTEPQPGLARGFLMMETFMSDVFRPQHGIIHATIPLFLFHNN